MIYRANLVDAVIIHNKAIEYVTISLATIVYCRIYFTGTRKIEVEKKEEKIVNSYKLDEIVGFRKID